MLNSSYVTVCEFLHCIGYLSVSTISPVSLPGSSGTSSKNDDVELALMSTMFVGVFFILCIVGFLLCYRKNMNELRSYCTTCSCETDSGFSFSNTKTCCASFVGWPNCHTGDVEYPDRPLELPSVESGFERNVGG